MFLHINALSIDKKLYDLLSYGRIECTVHSIFHRAINLKTSFGGMISIISRRNFNGPNTVLIEDKFLLTDSGINPESPVFCFESVIYFKEGFFISLHNALPWEYYLTERKINPEQIVKNMLYFISKISNIPLINAREVLIAKLSPFHSQSAVIALSENFISLLNSLKDNNRGRIKRSLSRIIGLGEGLTPAGDDLITGLLGIIYSFKRTTGFKAKADTALFMIKEEIDTEKTNFISSRFLSFSLEGRFSQPVLEFLDELFSPDALDEKFLKNMLSYGASSGIATVLGILSGCLLFVSSEYTSHLSLLT